MIIRGRYIEALATIEVQNLRPQDLTDDELREFGMMDDLVKRLREYTVTGHGPTMLEEEAADRIEQLERELKLWKESAEHSLVSDENLRDQLDAEKALADLLHDVAYACVSYENTARAAYRKARGL